MRRQRDQTRLTHYFIAIAWFSAAMAICSAGTPHRRQLQARQRELAELRAERAGRASANPLPARPRLLVQEDVLLWCDESFVLYDNDLAHTIDAIPPTALFVFAGALMLAGHAARVWGLILGTWASCVWVFLHWLLALT
jgi:hypothetical protein